MTLTKIFPHLFKHPCTVLISLIYFRQVEDANEIESIAQQAYETSQDAYDMARAALNQQVDTADQVRVLVVQVNANF